MKYWRLTRKPYWALDGSGPETHGSRWTSPGLPVVLFATEAALCVLIIYRYLPRDLNNIDQDYILGFIESDATPQRLQYDPDPGVKRQRGDEWLSSAHSLFASVTSAVLPEADVIMMNPLHADAHKITPPKYRNFRFEDCLHLPRNTEMTQTL